MYIPNDAASASPDLSLAPAPRNRYRVAPTSRLEAAERRRAEQELRNALAHDQLVMHFQPRVCLATGATIGAEALIRWPHRKRGMLGPAAFLPTARRSSLITRIGGWALRTACSEAAEWQDRGKVSVNIAARQMVEGVLLEQVAEALDLSGLAPERLELELTEPALIDIDVDIMLMLSAIRDLGVGLTLDEFGTHHASLNVLKRVPLTGLKRDRSIVRDLPHFREETDTVRGILDIGHAMNLSVAACGIETEAQREFLAGIGCDEGQGFLFDPALPADQFAARSAEESRSFAAEALLPAA